MGDHCSKHVKLPDVDGTEFRKYKFPFENLVLQGGGAWGVCQVGALKVLDDAGILQNIKRFGGTSVGAVVAGLLAVGMAPQELADKLNENLKDIAYDKPPSDCFLYKLGIPDKYVADIWYLYNLTQKFGIMPGEAFLDWYGKTIEEHLHAKGFDSLNGDINFWQVYDVLGKELCTVSYETEFTSEVYSHVKTSPLLEIKKGVRMSMSIPVIFEAYKSSFGDIQPRHIDGGVSAGYPIYCFEGWWLSMDRAKTFAKRLEGKDAEKNFLPGVSREHFDVEGSEEHKTMVREKTVGLAMFTDIHHGDKYQVHFEQRIAECLENNPRYKKELQPPSTKLANKYHEKQEQLKKTQDEFAKELEEGFTVGDKIKDVAAAYPDEAEMWRIFNELTDEQMEIITAGMDGNPNRKAVFKLLFLDYAGKPTTALALDIYDNQMPLQQAKNDCLKGNFAETPMELYGQFMQFVGKNKPMEEYDVGRSVGINCSYVGMLDFDLETEDKEFLMAQGAVAALAFLEDWVSKHPELEEVPVQQTTTA